MRKPSYRGAGSKTVVGYRRTLAAALCALTAGSGLGLAGALAEPASAATRATLTTTSGPVPTSTEAPKPVAPSVHTIALTGAAARSAQSAPAGSSAGSSTGSSTGTPAVLTAATSTAGFQTAGITWAGRSTGVNLVISIRTRDSHDSRGWTVWQDLDDDAGDDPTPAAGSPAGLRGGTDPRWVGPSDGVQARIVVKSGTLPPDLKLELVDAGSSGYDATAAATTPGATANLSAASATEAVSEAVTAAATSGVAEPAVLSRAQWGADESKVKAAPTYMPTIKAFVMHHTAGPNNYTAAQVPSIIRGDYAYHLSRGWNDIGYNALVDRFGRIWEGRAGGLSRNVMGAHAGGFNTDTFGVAVIGNYDTAKPTAAAVNAVARIMAWKADLNHRDPMGTVKLTSSGGGTARWPAGVTRTFNVIMGHRDTGQTDCPGRYLYPYLASIRGKVKAIMKAALTNPTGPPSGVATGRPVSVTARALAAQTWTLTVGKTCAGGRVATVTGSAKAGAAITATWNGLAAGVAARPGAYTLTLTSKSSAATARPLTWSTIVVPPTPAAAATGTLSGGASGYVPVTPTRVYDTRTAGHLPIGPKGRIDVPVLGRAGVPATGVSAVVLNVTTGCLTGATSFTVAATGVPTTRAATSVPAGVTRTFLVTSRIGAGGAVSIGNASGVSELTADVVGYYATGTGTGTSTGAPLLAVPSTRVYDSANDAGGPVAVGSARTVPLPATIGGVPVSAVSAVMVDVSAIAPTGAGTLTAAAPGATTTLPALTFRKGESVDNLAVVPVTGGALTLSATGSAVRAVLDVRALVLNEPVGTPGTTRFVPRAPVRAADSAKSGGALAKGKIRKVVVTGTATGIPATAKAVLIDLTAVKPAQATALQAYAAGAATGGAALRAPAGDSRGNLAVVAVGAGGAIDVVNSGVSTQLTVDVVGYFL